MVNCQFCGKFATNNHITMDNNGVAERIKFLMKELNYRQVDFAQKIDVDTSNLSKYLNGRLAMSEALINKIVVNLGVSKQWLETGEDLPFAKQQPQQLVTVPESQIAQMLGNAEEKEVETVDVLNDFMVGETVKVSYGPFSGFFGEIREVNREKQELTVMVKVFGRETPLKLENSQVERE